MEAIVDRLPPSAIVKADCSAACSACGFNLRAEAVLETLTEDVLKSSESEGKSSIRIRSVLHRCRVGMDIGALTPDRP